jgi:hypothetical protein
MLININKYKINMDTNLIWKPLKVYNHNCTELYDYSEIYKVSDTGIVFSIKRKNTLKNFTHISGYTTVALSKDGKMKHFLLHRVVLSSFVQDENLYKNDEIYVNHKDRNPGNNNLINLEWITRIENIYHSNNTEKFEKEKVEIKIYNECDHVFVEEIKHNNHYEIYSDGRVYSKRTKKFLKPSCKNGYLSVVLYPEAKTYLIHRLVAEAFIENKDNKPLVNHIDENKQNNNYTNLEWSTHSENIMHSLSKVVYKYDLKGNFIEKYNSVKEAALKNNIMECNISSVMNSDNRFTSGNFIWKNTFEEITDEELDNINNKENPRSLSVYQICADSDEIINIYKNIKEASDDLDIDPSTVSKVCRGIVKTCGGYKWQYADIKNKTTKFTEEEKKNIFEEYNNGMLTKELAEKYNKSISSIQRTIKKYLKNNEVTC